MIPIIVIQLHLTNSEVCQILHEAVFRSMGRGLQNMGGGDSDDFAS